MLSKEILDSFIHSLNKKIKDETFALIGFDGFVDQIIKVVDKRYNADDYLAFNKISDYIDRNHLAINRSLNIELVPQYSKLGGNGPIMANSMQRLGIHINYIGALGKDAMHSIFENFVKRVPSYPITDPGFTDALEFSDGKIMLGKTHTMKDITWESIIKKVGSKKLSDLIKKSSLLATVNWTMLPFMSDIWENLMNFIDKEKISKDKFLFIDLADFQKRSDEDCIRAFQQIKQMQRYFKVHLGLNLKETNQMAKLLKLNCHNDLNQQELVKVCQEIFNKLEISSLLSHSSTKVVIINKETSHMLKLIPNKNPLISTGAGDHFNAAYSTGLLLGLTAKESAIFGVLNSNFYIRTGISPSLGQIKNFAKLCLENKEEEIRTLFQAKKE